MLFHRLPPYIFAALAWLLGTASLLGFGLHLWTGSVCLIKLPLSESSLILWDITLCFIFFLQHSILVRRSVRHQLARVIPEPALGLVYTITSAGALATLVLLWQHSSSNLYVLQDGARWVMRAALLLSFSGFFWGLRALKKFDAFGIGAFVAFLQDEQIARPQLAIAGPYRWIRHPFYAFAIVAIWSTPTLSLDRLAENILFTSWIVLGTTLEERDLLATFGDQYAAYRRAVPMLVPYRRPRIAVSKTAT